MDFSLILTSVAILGGVGLTFGTLIAIANAKLKVWEDPRIDSVEEVLPGANCGVWVAPATKRFPSSSKPAGSMPLRRSTRERKKAETIYDSAEKLNPQPPK